MPREHHQALVPTSDGYLRSYSEDFDFKNVPVYFSCLARMWQHCFAVKLQKCFVDYKSSPDFSAGMGRMR